MGAAFEVITGRVVNPGATLTAVTLATGDSLAVRSFDMSKMARLYDMWALGATAGTVRVRSPRIHDNVQGLRSNYAASDPRPLIPDEIYQSLYAQDVLIFEQSGGGAETDCASLLVYYDDLPGINARLYRWDEIQPRIANILSVETQHTTGATAGDYGGSLAINANFDLLKANVDYAILGFNTSVSVLTVGYKGPDLGNLRCGGPGHIQRDETRHWFLRQSKMHDKAFIPVFNAANKGSTFVDLVHTGTATAVTVNTIIAELRAA